MMIDPRVIARALNEMYPQSEWMVEDNDLDNIITISGPKINASSQEITTYAQLLIQKDAETESLKEQNRASAITKLSKLGLTEEEAKAIIGI